MALTCNDRRLLQLTLEMTLRRNRLARIAGARLIAGNIRLDAPASKRRGEPRALRADIWVKDSPGPWKTFSVRAGQLFDIACGRVAIVNIVSGAVVLELQERPCRRLMRAAATM